MNEDFEKLVGYAIGGFFILMLGGAALALLAQHIVPILAVLIIGVGGFILLRNLPRWQHEANRARDAAQEQERRTAALNAITVDEDGVTNIAKNVVASLRDA